MARGKTDVPGIAPIKEKRTVGYYVRGFLKYFGPALVEVPVPLLRGSEVFSHPLDIPTEQRGLIRVGPVQKIRSSPVGILRSNTTWGRPHRVFVYPKTVALPPTDVGLMRDLEGMESGRTVPDDLSFHAIREYVPGDPRNQIHWKSTAKTGQLMVRQYNESVRSEMLVVLGNAEQPYIDGEEFELAVSVGASFALRGMQEGRHLSVVTGPQSERQVLARTMRPLKTTSRRALMDGMTRLRWADGGLTLAEIVTEASAARGYGDPVSIAVLVTGSQTTASQIQTAALRLPLGVGALAVRCALDEPPALRVVGGITVITVAVLEDLRHLLLGQVQR